jgi:hypothetical protein
MRLARLRRKPDEFVKRLESQLWYMLDQHPDVRAEYGPPDGVPLEEHVRELTTEELEVAAGQLLAKAGPNEPGRAAVFKAF